MPPPSVRLGDPKATHYRLSSEELRPGLPPELFQMKALEDLNLCGLGLKTLPEALMTLTKLQRLNLSINEISELPSSIERLTQLETLLLGSPYGGISGQIQNPMRTLPESIGNLGNLKMMYMPGLKIESLPPSIAQLKDSLESLVLYVDDGDYTHSNPICRNPDAIVQLKEWLPNTEIVHDYVDIG